MNLNSAPGLIYGLKIEVRSEDKISLKSLASCFPTNIHREFQNPKARLQNQHSTGSSGPHTIYLGAPGLRPR